MAVGGGGWPDSIRNISGWAPTILFLWAYYSMPIIL